MRASPEPGLSEGYIIPIAREVAEALKWVHSAGIIHRDVKGPYHFLTGKLLTLAWCGD